MKYGGCFFLWVGCVIFGYFCLVRCWGGFRLSYGLSFLGGRYPARICSPAARCLYTGFARQRVANPFLGAMCAATRVRSHTHIFNERG